MCVFWLASFVTIALTTPQVTSVNSQVKNQTAPPPLPPRRTPWNPETTRRVSHVISSCLISINQCLIWLNSDIVYKHTISKPIFCFSRVAVCTKVFSCTFRWERNVRWRSIIIRFCGPAGHRPPTKALQTSRSWVIFTSASGSQKEGMFEMHVAGLQRVWPSYLHCLWRISSSTGCCLVRCHSSAKDGPKPVWKRRRVDWGATTPSL